MTRAERIRAYRSLINGVQELQQAWPSLETRGRFHDLVGFLFATLPLSEQALEEDESEEASWQRISKGPGRK